MTERGAELSALADRVTDAGRDTDERVVTDAWTAKSFSDRLFVVEVSSGARLPESVRATLHDHGLREANEVYELDGAQDADFAGDLADGRRYRFVDVQSRGEMQSYVVE